MKRARNAAPGLTPHEIFPVMAAKAAIHGWSPCESRNVSWRMFARSVGLSVVVLLTAALLAPSVVLDQNTVPAGVAAKVPLADVLALAEPYPNLRQEIRLALISAGQSRDGVMCAAIRIGEGWTALKPRAIGPYVCPIGNRAVTIRTQATFFDVAGHKLPPQDATLATKAARVTEARLAWTWKPLPVQPR
jgi:hypothetical protein